jgi:hypothetical protein
MGLLYVDDTIISVMDYSFYNAAELHEKVQSATTSWGELPRETGGGLKAPKCCGYLLMFDWDNNGEWSYVDLASLGYDLARPTDHGTESISLCNASTTKETLGVYTTPNGSSTGQLEKISNRISKWLGCIKGGTLPALFV